MRKIWFHIHLCPLGKNPILRNLNCIAHSKLTNGLSHDIRFISRTSFLSYITFLRAQMFNVECVILSVNSCSHPYRFCSLLVQFASSNLVQVTAPGSVHIQNHMHTYKYIQNFERTLSMQTIIVFQHHISYGQLWTLVKYRELTLSWALLMQEAIHPWRPKITCLHPLFAPPKKLDHKLFIFIYKR